MFASMSKMKKIALITAAVSLAVTGCSENEQANQENMEQKETEVTETKTFLELNKEKDGIEVTTSGLQYQVLLAGTGKTPGPTDNVTVHYEGTLLDGTIFDSSYERGEVIEFPLNRVIKGWTEGLQLMQEGAKYKFFIPSELAYGAGGAGGSIGPNEDLIFTVELIRVN